MLNTLPGTERTRTKQGTTISKRFPSWNGHPRQEHILVPQDAGPVSGALRICDQQYTSRQKLPSLTVSALDFHQPSQHHHELLGWRRVQAGLKTLRNAQKTDLTRVQKGRDHSASAGSVFPGEMFEPKMRDTVRI